MYFVEFFLDDGLVQVENWLFVVKINYENDESFVWCFVE